jgi:polysaccharide export outer membrane protein
MPLIFGTAMEDLGKALKMENKYYLKIFLVDNDPFCLNIYRRQLNNIGFGDVTQFNNITDCLDSLVLKPDVVFLDYRMDVMNDLELLKKIKRFDPDIYVVFIASPEGADAAINSLKYGAFDCALKKDDRLEGADKILSKIYEIGELLKNAQPALVKKFPG